MIGFNCHVEELECLLRGSHYTLLDACALAVVVYTGQEEAGQRLIGLGLTL